MKQITNNKGKLFTVLMLLSFMTFMSNCSGGPGYVPAGSNNTVCSQNLSSDMQKLLGCTTQQKQQTPPTNITLPPPIVVQNGGTFVSTCTVILQGGPIPIVLNAQSYGLGGAVGGATVSLFTSTSNKTANETPDIVVTTGSSGTVATTLPTGIPFAVKASASSYMDTYQFGEIVSAADANALLPVELMSGTIVSLASSSANVTQDPSMGAIVGTISNCDGDAIENAIVSLYNTSTGVTITTGIFYGNPPLGLPAPSLTWSSSQGDFLAFNVPPGTYQVIATGVLSASDTTTTVLGQSYAEAITGSVSIVNVQP
jgi:hypothetical protein